MGHRVQVWAQCSLHRFARYSLCGSPATACQCYNQLGTHGTKSSGPGVTSIKFQVTLVCCCRSPFDVLVPSLACTQMGMGRVGTRYPDDRFGPGEGPLFVHEVRCSGREASLQDCHLGPVNNTPCTPGNTTTVACSGGLATGVCHAKMCQPQPMSSLPSMEFDCARKHSLALPAEKHLGQCPRDCIAWVSPCILQLPAPERFLPCHGCVLLYSGALQQAVVLLQTERAPTMLGSSRQSG